MGHKTSSTPLPRTGASNVTIHIENGEQVYPCRCGETHRGPYAGYDYGHHNCFHEFGLIRLIAAERDDLICPACGKTFRVETSASSLRGRGR